MKEEWTPKQGEIILIGVPGVNLSVYEFIAVTSKDEFLVWDFNKTRALIFSREFCYKKGD